MTIRGIREPIPARTLLGNMGASDGPPSAVPFTTIASGILRSVPAGTFSGGLSGNYVIGDIVYANSTTTLANLADVATGNALISGGVATAPSWGKIGLTTHVSGTLPIANGGTNKTSWTAKTVVYSDAAGALTSGTSLFWDGSKLGVGMANTASDAPLAIFGDGTVQMHIHASTADGAYQEYWKDATPTFAGAIGMNVPGAAVTSNFTLSRWNGAAWSSLLSFDGSTGVPTFSSPVPAGSGGTGLTSLGTGVATFLGTPSSANFEAALTDDTLISLTCQGRLTLTTGVPVTTTDVTAAGTLYFTPYLGNRIATYNGSKWSVSSFTEKSIAVPAVANQVYDVFIVDSTLALELVAWTNDTTRATAITTQNGILVKSGATTRRYLGTVRTVTASQLNDSVALRHVWNYYNRVNREMFVVEATATWTYTTATWRQANANTANQLDFVIGVSEDSVDVAVVGRANNTNTGVIIAVQIGVDNTTTPSTSAISYASTTALANADCGMAAFYKSLPGIGRHYLAWLEFSVATGTTTWNSSGFRGISGTIRG